MQVLSLSLDSIQIVGSNKRDDDINDLIQSMGQYGLLQPIIVMSVDADSWRLIAGRRRLAAAKALKWAHIKAIPWQTLDEGQLRILRLEENLRRKDLTWEEHVREIEELHALWTANDPDWNQRRTALALDASPSSITRRLRVAAALHNPDDRRLLTLEAQVTNWTDAYEELVRRDNLLKGGGRNPQGQFTQAGWAERARTAGIDIPKGFPINKTTRWWLDKIKEYPYTVATVNDISPDDLDREKSGMFVRTPYKLRDGKFRWGFKDFAGWEYFTQEHMNA